MTTPHPQRPTAPAVAAASAAMRSRAETRSRHRGFTLIELMITLTVAAILLMVGVPNFQEFIKSNRLSARTNAFVADLNQMRSEAIKRGGRVSMCKSTTLTGCASSGGWEQGWIIFSDMNGTAGQVDTGGANPDVVLRKNGPSNGGVTIRGNSTVQTRISYNSAGTLDTSMSLDGNPPPALIFCDNRISNSFNTNKAKARVIVISMIGRIRTMKGNNSTLSNSISNCTPS